MPITLSDEALSRWIAEKLEPRPVFIGGHNASPLDLWHAPDWMTLIPRDMVGDPQMTVMLMEKMMASQFSTRLLLKQKRVVVETWELGYATYQSLGRGIAEAWALANGYHEEPL